MKFFLSILLFITLSFNLNAQGAQGFNYQATVRNASGDLILNQNVNFKFNILQGSQTAAPSYTETHDVQTDDLGQISLVIGKGVPSNGVFSDIDWSLGNYFLDIKLNTGNGYVAMGTTQFYSVPYALYAENAGSAVTAESADSAGTNLDTSIRGNVDSYILKNLLSENVTDTIQPLGANFMISEQTTEGVRLYQYGLSDNVFTSTIGKDVLDLQKGHKYVLAWKQRYNQPNAIEWNGHGFVLFNGSSFSQSFSKGISSPIRIPLNSLNKWYNLATVINFDLQDGEYSLVYRSYSRPEYKSTDFINDVNIKDLFLFDVGVKGDYFYDKSPEFFQALLSDKTYFESLVVQDTSSKSESNSLIGGGLLKSLGDSLPETRTYQGHVANELGMYYDGDYSTSVDVDGITIDHLSFVIGGTWCAPVTTPAGGSQTIENSAYMRSKFLKYYKPKVLLIECGTNDADFFSDVYGGKNPDGITPYDYGLNDIAYDGEGVDVSNGVFQDENGVNLAPSLGASFRGMLKRLVTELPDTKIVVIGVPRSHLTVLNGVSFNQKYYDASLGKNTVLEQVAKEFGCPFVDIFNGAGTNAYTLKYNTIDNIHFSTEGGRKVAMAIMKDAF